MSSQANPNALIYESSPYLLQHAHNPVHWVAWSEEAFQKAKKENKPVLVSIGYSSCHWCHVMEHESFEDTSIAQIMNENFICIKVDREERPDVDQIYMEALQSMGLGGGWPLNVFVTADKKPFYGGTYFPPKKWITLLQNIAHQYEHQPNKIVESAEKLTQYLQTSDVKKYGLKDTTLVPSPQDLDKLYPLFASRFDTQKGGMDKEPKFPMPSIYEYLLTFYQLKSHQGAAEHVKLTLDEMAAGGIYDQLGGGFARYSTDADWFAPHFEKMLYDNGQLLSLYSHAYALFKSPRYLSVIDETIHFLQKEMMSSEFAFYAALDADSEGEEGKFYTWEYDEILYLLQEDTDLFVDYYGIKIGGNWEATNILHTTPKKETIFLKNHKLTSTELAKKIAEWKSILLPIREKRIYPGLDDKALASWNALTLRGIIDAYKATLNEGYLALAEKNAEFIVNNLLENGRLHHTYKNGQATLHAHLDDYSATINAFTALYQVTFDEKWIKLADSLANYTVQHFYDAKESLFYYSDTTGEPLIARKKEIFDNVIPSSNSMMAEALHVLHLYTGNKKHEDISTKMIGRIYPLLFKEPSFMANWARIFAYKLNPTAEIIIVGPGAVKAAQNLNVMFLPNVIIAASIQPSKYSTLPILKNRTAIQGKLTYYVCYNQSCQLPVHTLKEALNLLK